MLLTKHAKDLHKALVLCQVMTLLLTGLVDSPATGMYPVTLMLPPGASAAFTIIAPGNSYQGEPAVPRSLQAPMMPTCSETSLLQVCLLLPSTP